MAQARLAALDTSGIDWSGITEAGDGLSHADVTRACEHAAKNAILRGERVVTTDELVGALRERRRG